MVQRPFARIVAAVLIAVFALSAPAYAQNSVQGTVRGRILETSAGFPVAGAKVELQQNAKTIASATTTSDGSFSVANVPPGDYVAVVSDAGFVPSSTPIVVAYGAITEFQTALSPARTGLKEIANVRAGGRGTLQTTATINSTLPQSIVTDQNYVRAGDALQTLPFITGSTSSSLGDDLSLSLRGFDPTESATLLDGHPIGPIGAHGTSFDYQLAQFTGFANAQVIYGSGATGLYAVPVLGGAVNFESLNPTQAQHASFSQSVGDLGKLSSSATVTGTVGRLGYALAYGTQGLDGELGPQPIFQSGLLNGGQSRCPNSPSALAYVTAFQANPNLNGGSLPPTIQQGDINACTYTVGGSYLNRNALVKFTYQLGPRTSILASVWNSSMWADSSGNGDTDFVPYEYQLAVANASVSGGPVNFQLPNGNQTTCAGSTIAALSDAPGGFSCLTPQQDAQNFSGPQGGGLERYHAAQNGDYHLRVTQGLGKGNLILDGFVDNYHFVNQKGPINFVIQANSYLDNWTTHGGLIGYELAGEKNDLSFGVNLLHQLYLNNSGSSLAFGPYNQSATLNETSYYVHDEWTPPGKLSVFADLSLEHSQNTATNSFDPRVALVYKPTSNDVIRIAGGRASSEPDPSIVTGGIMFGPPVASNPSFNPQQSCGTTGLIALGGGSSPLVKPETANDVEIALAHRFANQASVELDAYNTVETNPIISSVYPLSIVPAATLAQLQPNPAAYFQAYANAINLACGTNLTQANFGVSAPFNAGKADYRGYNLQSTVPIVRNVEIDGNYAVQVAYYDGLSNDILFNNTGYINGSQFYGVPLQTANVGVGYQNAPGGLTARFDDHFVAKNNGFNRPAYSFATANVSKTVGPVTFNLGVYNVFNQDSGQFGLIGLGSTYPTNQYGSPSSISYNNNAELYFLPVRQIEFTTTFRF